MRTGEPAGDLTTNFEMRSISSQILGCEGYTLHISAGRQTLIIAGACVGESCSLHRDTAREVLSVMLTDDCLYTGHNA